MRKLKIPSICISHFSTIQCNTGNITPALDSMSDTTIWTHQDIINMCSFIASFSTLYPSNCTFTLNPDAPPQFDFVGTSTNVCEMAIRTHYESPQHNFTSQQIDAVTEIFEQFPQSYDLNILIFNIQTTFSCAYTNAYEHIYCVKHNDLIEFLCEFTKLFPTFYVPILNQDPNITRTKAQNDTIISLPSPIEINITIINTLKRLAATLALEQIEREFTKFKIDAINTYVETYINTLNLYHRSISPPSSLFPTLLTLHEIRLKAQHDALLRVTPKKAKKFQRI